MRIGELADQADVNPKTIRYYEQIGLLAEPDRTPGGYRTYDSDDVDRLQFIRRAQQLDLRLDEIAEILALREGDHRPCHYVRQTARQRLDDVERRLDELRRTRDELRDLLDRADCLPTDHDGYCQLIEHQRPTH